MVKKTATKATPKKEVKTATKKKVVPVPVEYETLEHDLLTQNYTKILFETPCKPNAPSLFKVIKAKPESKGPNKGNNLVLGLVQFQEGPVNENGVNGVANEDLIGMVLCRLESFQNSEYKCRENAIAITKLEEALMWLRKRTNSRIKRNVVGTSKV